MSAVAPLAAEIATLCRALKLPTVARDAEALAGAGQRQGLGLLEYLHHLLEAELTERASRRAQRRLKEAAFPRLKTLEGFDFARNPSLPETRTSTLHLPSASRRCDNSAGWVSHPTRFLGASWRTADFVEDQQPGPEDGAFEVLVEAVLAAGLLEL